jgi:hypothetical protein
LVGTGGEYGEEGRQCRGAEAGNNLEVLSSFRIPSCRADSQADRPRPPSNSPRRPRPPARPTPSSSAPDTSRSPWAGIVRPSSASLTRSWTSRLFLS